MFSPLPDNGCMTHLGIILVGGGGHAQVVLDALLENATSVRGFVDDRANCPLAGVVDRLGGLETLNEDARVLLCIGDVATRRRVLGVLAGARIVGPVIHPSAVVSPSASIAEGAFVGPGAIINADARIGAHAIVNSGAIVEHDCRVGENTHVAPGAVLGGGVEVGSDSLVGMGSRVLPGVSIGTGSIIGAGAVVTVDVGDGETVVGVPGRVVVGDWERQ